MAKFLRRSNSPIVGRYVEVTPAEDVAIAEALTEKQETQLRYAGWVEVEYQYENRAGAMVRYPSAIVRLAE